MNIILLLLLLVSSLALNGSASETSENAQKRVMEFERQLVFDDGKGNPYSQRSEVEQRPLVAAFFATLTTPEDKIAFLGTGDSRYVYSINRTVYAEYAAKLLKDPDSAVRRESIRGLTYTQQKQYSGQIEVMLDDPDVGIRAAAMEAMGRFGQHQQAARIAVIERSTTNEVERSAGFVALAALLRDKNATDGQHAMELLIVAQFLGSDTPAMKQVLALSALAAVSEASRHLDAIIPLASSTNDHVRARAVETLGTLDKSSAFDAVRQALTDPSGDVRRTAVAALGNRKAIGEAANVAKLLEDTSPSVRAAAVVALSEMQADTYVDTIARRLNDEKDFVRKPALMALLQMKATNYASQVETLLRDPNDQVQFAALRTLYDIGSSKQGAAVAVLATNASSSVRLWVLQTLDALNARDQRVAVETLTRDSDHDIARGAAAVLSKWDKK